MFPASSSLNLAELVVSELIKSISKNKAHCKHQAEHTYVISVTKLLNSHGVKNSYQRTTRKMSNENIILSFLALQENILLQQHDLLE